jgi:hypothetical protein
MNYQIIMYALGSKHSPAGGSGADQSAVYFAYAALIQAKGIFTYNLKCFEHLTMH